MEVPQIGNVASLNVSDQSTRKWLQAQPEQLTLPYTTPTSPTPPAQQILIFQQVWSLLSENLYTPLPRIKQLAKASFTRNGSAQLAHAVRENEDDEELLNFK